MKEIEGKIYVNYGRGWTLTDADEPNRLPDPHATYSYVVYEEDL